MCEILQWIEQHPGLASWLQAGGALVAIFISLVLWRHDVRERENKSKSAALGLAVSVSEELYDLCYGINLFIKGFPLVPNMISFHGINHQLHEGMTVPEKLSGLEGKLHELGDLSFPIQSLMLEMRHVSAIAQKKEWTIMPGKKATTEYDEQIIESIKSIHVDLEKAIEMINLHMSLARKKYRNV